MCRKTADNIYLSSKLSGEWVKDIVQNIEGWEKIDAHVDDVAVIDDAISDTVAICMLYKRARNAAR